MNITDVPTSGIYYQEGAIVEIVLQIIDIETGLPVQLQTASALSISILYPDLVTTQTFAAFLYTDGSDGRIAYITRNDGVNIDLNQVGLYQMQGNAFIGSVAIPPSYETDFYVLLNVFGNTNPPPAANQTALILYDTNNVRWAVTVDPAGALHSAATPVGPNNYLWFNLLVMKDPSGVYWQVGISTIGVIITTPGGTFPNALESFLLIDANNKSWVVTITELGVLITA